MTGSICAHDDDEDENINTERDFTFCCTNLVRNVFNENVYEVSTHAKQSLLRRS